MKSALSIKVNQEQLYINPITLKMTLKEIRILKFLLQNIDNIVTRKDLMIVVWGFDYGKSSRTLDVHINSLRKKLAGFNLNIKTIRGQGYTIY